MVDPKDVSQADPGSAPGPDQDKTEQPDTDDPQRPARVSTAISSGKPFDDAGGAGLGQPPGKGDLGSPAAPESQEKIAADPQDRRDKS
jgi:hypothetical protein